MTFSQLVDSLALEFLRPDLRAAIESYINLTIRELHSASKSGGAILYAANMQELQITADVDTGFTWDIPSPHLFQKMEAVRFDAFGQGEHAFAKERTPQSLTLSNRFDRFFYRSGYTMSFINYGGVDAVITLAWYQVPPRLRYYAVALRPASWSEDSQGFTYLSAYSATDNLKTEARLLTTNWILDRWPDHVAQGVRVKVFSRMGDEVRSKLAYSLYESMRPDIVSAETYSNVS